jgi:SAM-dependent methyltransferase
METAKARARRQREGWFERYAPADRPGLDVGCAYDPLHPESPHWLQLDLGFTDFDLGHDARRRRGDATDLAGGYPHLFHTVYASHCLEHLHNPLWALRSWWSAVEPGGHLVVCVPHYRLYEKRTEPPSAWNPDHKWFWTDGGTPGPGEEGWPFVLSIFDVFEAAIRVRPEVRILDEGYDANGDGHPLGEFSIEAILRKPAAPA